MRMCRSATPRVGSRDPFRPLGQLPQWFYRAAIGWRVTRMPCYLVARTIYVIKLREAIAIAGRDRAVIRSMSYATNGNWSPEWLRAIAILLFISRSGSDSVAYTIEYSDHLAKLKVLGLHIKPGLRDAEAPRTLGAVSRVPITPASGERLLELSPMKNGVPSRL